MAQGGWRRERVLGIILGWRRERVLGIILSWRRERVLGIILGWRRERVLGIILGWRRGGVLGIILRLRYFHLNPVVVFVGCPHLIYYTCQLASGILSAPCDVFVAVQILWTIPGRVFGQRQHLLDILYLSAYIYICLVFH